MAFECTKCSSGEGVAVAVIVVSALGVAGAALVVYLVSNEREEDGGRGFIVRVKDKVSFRSLKIVIVVWQILTQVKLCEEMWVLFATRGGIKLAQDGGWFRNTPTKN